MNPITDLNPAQREAVQCSEGPLLVLAGAGSGKTRVLTCRIAHLIDAAGVPPWNILAVTFTNKAAGEMRERIGELVGSDSSGIWMGTFHSVCARILRYESQAFGIDSSFTIYDEEDRRILVRKILADLEVDEQELSPRAAAGRISRAKNGMADAAAFREQISSSSAPQNRITADVFERYESELRQNNAFDFDDLICEPVRRFQQHPEVLEKYRNRFRYILIDEYQDTNRPQYLLARQLAAEHRNICCVGDDDQSIYQFRGADIRNILDFERDYPDATVVRLEQNYRSTGRILEAANAVIRHNLDRKGKNLWTQAEEGDPLRVGDCGDDRAEARHIVAAISATCRKEGLSLREAAVLYRTNAQSRALEEELQRGGVPYAIVGGIRFYERREIKDLLAYLRLLANPADDVSLLRIINVPKRGIGAATIQRLREVALRGGMGLLQAVTDGNVPGLGTRAATSLERFAAILRGLRRDRERLELPELAEQVLVRTGYLDALRDDPSVEARSREENIGQLLARIAEFQESGPAEPSGSERRGLEGFLEEVALMSPVDETGTEADSVTLMTLHMAKGLEFPLVFIAGMEEGLFPTARAIEESRSGGGAIEEERRLFYVGITRAQRFLALTFARWRYSFGSLSPTEPSRFLEEVPRELVEVEEVSHREGIGFTAAQRRADSDRRRGSGRARHLPSPKPKAAVKKGIHYEFDDEPGSAAGEAGDDLLAVGRWVRHPAFGRGEIVDREGSGEDLKLSIRFGSSRPKKIMVAYAHLEPA